MNQKKISGIAFLALFLVSCGGTSRTYSSSQSSFVPATYSIEYLLNGGTNDPDNPSTYSNNGESIALQNPFREDYDFKRWMKGSDVVTEIKPSWNKDVTLEAIWAPHPYKIHYIVGEGANHPNNPATYTIESFDIDLQDASLTGSTFLGWYDNAEFQGERVYSIERGTKGDLALYARFAQAHYVINYVLNGGSNNEANPSSYDSDQEIVFAEPSRPGYNFLGWFDKSGNQVNGIPQGSSGPKVVEAKWQAQKHEINLAPNREGLGNCTVVSGQGYTDEMITVEATATGDNTFIAWYEGDERVSAKSTYTFKMPSHDITLTAMIHTPEEELWPTLHGMVPTLSEDGSTILYGLYPQRVVTDEQLIAALNALPDDSKGSNGYYLYENEYYASVVATPTVDVTVRDPARFDDGSVINSEATYWFHCDRLSWRVLGQEPSGAYFVMAKEIVEPHVFDTRLDENHEYATSQIRDYVIGEFFNSAFGLESDHLFGTAIDGDKVDKVTLPSIEDITNADYGFEDLDTGFGASPNDPYKSLVTGEWARCKGIGFTASQYRLNQGGYWSRSYNPYYGPKYVYTAGHGGLSNSRYDYNETGIAPVIRVLLNSSN